MLICFKCGENLPDNVVFCLHCGARLDDEQETIAKPAASGKEKSVSLDEMQDVLRRAERMQPPKRKGIKNNSLTRFLVFSFGVLFLMCLMVWFANQPRNSPPVNRNVNVYLSSGGSMRNDSMRNDSTPTPTPTPAPVRTPKPKIINQPAVVETPPVNNQTMYNNSAAPSSPRIRDQSISLPPGQWWKFDKGNITEQALNMSFRASSPVEVYLMDYANYAAWVRGDGFSYIYFSGRVSNGTVSYKLSSGGYMLVVSNRFSIFTGKNINLRFSE